LSTLSELTTKDIFLRHRGKGFNETFSSFISDATKAVQRKVAYEELSDYQEEVGQLIGEAASLLYYTRKFRDEALGAAYEKYPKGSALSEEQIALARRDSSLSIRTHELTKEIVEALKVRNRMATQQLELHARG
jgi:hypothetical protein